MLEGWKLQVWDASKRFVLFKLMAESERTIGYMWKRKKSQAFNQFSRESFNAFRTLPYDLTISTRSYLLLLMDNSSTEHILRLLKVTMTAFILTLLTS
jgi:hypothetical protein